MQHEYGNFFFNRVAELVGLVDGSVNGNSHLSDEIPPTLAFWKREDVGGMVQAQKGAVEASKLTVAGEEAAELAAARYAGFDAVGHRAQALSIQSLRGPPEDQCTIVG